MDKITQNYFRDNFSILLLISTLLLGSVTYAQPTVLGTQLVNGSYTTYDLVTRGGGVRYVRLQATSAGSISTRNWEFATGTAGAANYTTNWRPYTASQTLSAYNSYIDPSSAASSARYNTSSGGSSGLLRAIVNSSFYTINVGGNSASNNFMSVLETTYNPKNVTATTQSPVAASVGVGMPVTVTITTSASLSSGEYAYVRYSNDGFATSAITAVTMSGTSGTGIISGATNTIGATVSYYVFTSNQATAPSVTQADYFTINLYNASGQNVSGGGSNFSYSVTGGSNPQYTWNQTGTASYATAANWTPTRTTPGVFDVLNFNNAATTTVTNVPTSETIGGLLISSNTVVTFATTTASTITISNGVSGADLSVTNGSQLKVLSSSVQNITIAAGATGSVSGAMNFNGNGASTAHQLIATDTSSLTFNSGSVITQDTNFTGTLFGSSLPVNTVIFASGSTFIRISGSSPFGLTQPQSKVVFQTGSLYKDSSSNAPSFAGRTYANFEWTTGAPGASTGGTGFTADNFTVSGGTLLVNLTGTSSIKGNISVASGASLTFNPASATTINLNGSGVQTITNGGTLSISSSANLTVVSGSIVDFGTSIINGAGTFTAASGSTIRTANTAGITVAGGGATGSVQTTTRAFNSGANYVYNGTANQITGTGLPSTIATLTINNSGSSPNNLVTLTATTVLSATTNSLLLQAGKLDLGNKQITISSGGIVTSTGGDFSTALGSIFFIGAGSTSGTLNFPNVRMANAGGVSFGSGANIVTSLTLEANSYVSGAPTYAANSTLIYSTGGTYDRNVEWGATSGAGYPYNVTIQNGTTLNLYANGFGNRAIAGNLNLGVVGTSSNGNLTMGSMNTSLTVGGNIVIGGTTSGSCNLALSTAVGGDVYLSGNWDTKVNGTYASNTRAVFFQGTGTSTVTTIGAATFDYLFINKTSSGTVTLANDMTVNNSLVLNSQLVTTVAYKVIIPNGGSVTANSGGWVNGNLQKDIPTGTNSRTFEIGDATAYTPVITAFSSVGTAGTIAVKTTTNDHLQIATSGINNAKSVNRFYSITNTGVVGGTYDATFTFVSGDVDGGATTSNFVVRNYLNPNWFTTTTGTRTSTTTQATGLSTYGDFQVGEANPLTVNVQPNNASSCVGISSSFTSSSTSIPTPTVKWQRNNGSGFVDIDNIIDGAVYTNFNTSTVTISNVTGLNGYTYQAIFTNINGSITSNIATLTVNSLPNAMIVTNNVPICAGDDALFYVSGTANAVVTYKINAGANQTTTLSGAGLATITVAAVLSTPTIELTKVTNPTTTCFLNISDFSTVTVYPLPTASITGNNGTVCSGENANYYLTGTTDAEVTYNINGGAPQTIILTGGSATASVPATGTMVFNLEFVTNTATSCYQMLSGSSTVTSYANVWTGTTGNWNVSGNWSCGVVPNIASVVEINSGAATITADAECYSLTITGTPTLTVNSNFDLTVSQTLDVASVTSGTGITVQNNANLLQNAASNSNNGTKVNIIRNSSPLNRLDYTLWSSPTIGSQTLAGFSPLTSANRFYTYNEGTDAYVANNGSGTFATAKGYLIRMPNNSIVYPGTPTLWTGTFTGKPNSGTITYSMVKTTNGYNAVGNPYPSAISIADFINYNVNNYSNISGTIWLWRKTNDAANTTYYSTCTNAGCTLENGHTYSDDTLLSVAQGFLVKATTSGASTLYFNNSMRSSANINQFFRINNTKNRFWLELKNQANTSLGTKLIAYLPEATSGYDDKLDGLFIQDRTTALLSVVDNKELVIQARSSFEPQDIVPLLFKTNTAGNYSVSLKQLEGIFSMGQDILLRDNQTGIVHDLNRSGAYNFTSAIGNFSSRFEIIYQNALSNAIFAENAVVVYNNNHNIHINTGKVTMDKVNIYDVRGRLLIEKTKVNTSEMTIDGSKIANQVILVQITTTDGLVVTKKNVN